MIPRLLCGGRAKVRGDWSKNLKARGSRSAPLRLALFLKTLGSACNRTVKRERELSIQTAMPNLNSSTNAPLLVSVAAKQRCQWTRKRKKSSATRAIRVAPTNPKVSRERRTHMISRIRKKAKLLPMESTTFTAMRHGFPSGSVPIQLSSPLRRSACGGSNSAEKSTRTRNDCW